MFDAIIRLQPKIMFKHSFDREECKLELERHKQGVKKNSNSSGIINNRAIPFHLQDKGSKRRNRY